MFAATGDRVTLPCPVARGSGCTSVSWNRADPFFALIKPGQVMDPNVTDPNVTLLSDCSLLIKHMDHSYPAVYICQNGEKTWNVELQFLNITKNQENPVELQCYINNHRGLSLCTEPGLRVMWVAEDNSPLRGQRFQIDNVSNCFFKLHFRQKQTDHLRRWRCQVQVNGSVKATASYLTTAAVIAQMDAERHNATLSCVLTCACDPCDSDFNLTWSEADNTFINSDLIVRNRSLLIKFWIPVASLGRGDVVCSALREGVPVVTKKWSYNKSSPLRALAWIAVPIVILCCVSVVYYRKRRHKDSDTLQADINLTHVYEDLNDYEPKCKKEAVTSNDSFYNLLQAVN
uniref:Ig-like domain-containing protein n=1 Tax=Knipowitschia caucasica TaxID=637954 RepID=A0AAV2MB79_KNICA